MRTNHTSPRPRLMSVPTVRVAALLVALPLALAACGSTTNTPGIASAGGVPSTSTETSESTPSDKVENPMLALAQCMRENGFDIPDPEEGGGISIPMDMGSPKAKEAMEKCGKQTGVTMRNAPMPGDMRESLLAYAQCMRDNGINMADPKFDGGPIRLGGPELGDPNSPTFKKAQEACQSKLPNVSGRPGDGTAP